METAPDTNASKRFRWLGQPSEEELLGLPPSRHGQRTPHHGGVSFLPRSAPAPEPAPPSAPLEASTERGFRGRDVLTLAAVAAAVWFAVSGAGNGLPFRGSGADPAPKASETTSARIARDRRELASLPRPAEAAGKRTGPASQSTGGDAKGQGANQDPKPSDDGDGGGGGGGGGGGETTDPPLLEATVPGVGSVTLENPDLPLPEDTPTTSDLLDTGDVLSDQPTVPLP
jgi:hypothetical protein